MVSEPSRAGDWERGGPGKVVNDNEWYFFFEILYEFTGSMVKCLV